VRGTGFRGAGGFQFGYQLTPWVKRLLIANAAVFFFTFAIDNPRWVTDWLAFQPDRLFVRPWGVLTYMFVHADLGHVFMNMLVLFFFGPPLEREWGSKEFIRYYLICGLGGVALSLMFLSAPIIGASAAVYGVMMAFAIAWPTTPIYIWGIFPVQARWLIAFLFAMTFMSAFGGAGGNIAHFAHLGGLITGFIYLKSDWRTVGPVGRVKKMAKRTLAIVPRQETKTAEVGSARAQRESPTEEKAMLDAIDRVLDKISAHGMASLTTAEKKLLDDVSRRRRSN
jgi:rhomboid family protein